jgi:hypothetical protein
MSCNKSECGSERLVDIQIDRTASLAVELMIQRSTVGPPKKDYSLVGRESIFSNDASLSFGMGRRFLRFMTWETTGLGRFNATKGDAARSPKGLAEIKPRNPATP